MRFRTRTRRPPPDLTRWHRWFAWRPVRVQDIGGKEWTYTKVVWLEKVYRKCSVQILEFVEGRTSWRITGKQYAFLPGPEDTP